MSTSDSSNAIPSPIVEPPSVEHWNQLPNEEFISRLEELHPTLTSSDSRAPYHPLLPFLCSKIETSPSLDTVVAASSVLADLCRDEEPRHSIAQQTVTSLLQHLSESECCRAIANCIADVDQKRRFVIPWIPEIVKCLTPAATLILFNLCIDFDEGAQALSVHLDNLVDRAIATNDETNGDDLKICSLFDVVEILLDSGCHLSTNQIIQLIEIRNLQLLQHEQVSKTAMASLEILELLCGEIELNHLEFGPLLSKMVGDDAADSSILSPTFTRRFLTWCDAGLQQCDDESGEKSEGKSLDDKGDVNSIADKCDANSLQMIGSLCLGNQAKSRELCMQLLECGVFSCFEQMLSKALDGGEGNSTLNANLMHAALGALKNVLIPLECKQAVMEHHRNLVSSLLRILDTSDLSFIQRLSIGCIKQLSGADADAIEWLLQKSHAILEKSKSLVDLLISCSLMDDEFVKFESCRTLVELLIKAPTLCQPQITRRYIETFLILLKSEHALCQLEASNAFKVLFTMDRNYHVQRILTQVGALCAHLLTEEEMVMVEGRVEVTLL